MGNAKLYLIIGFVFLLSVTAKAQISLPYYSGFDTPAQQSGWQLHQLGVAATYGPWVIGGSGYSAPSCLFHDYNVSGIVEDWYISPELSFISASKIALKIKAFAIMGMPIPTDYIGIWYSNGNSYPSSGDYAEVVNLTSLTSSGNLWIDTTINLPFTAGPGYVGFKYMNVDNWFTISIDNINVSAITTSINEEEEDEMQIFPNPTTGKLLIGSANDINSLEICDLAGKIISSVYEFKLQDSIEIDLSSYPKGIYIMRIIDGKKIFSKKIVIH